MCAVIKKALAKITVNCSSTKYCKIIEKAISPETKKLAKSRSKVKVEIEGKNLILFFKAKDNVALRASINSYLFWINQLKNILKSIQKLQKYQINN